jgi:site-specific DNA-methyltransferase (adenine-specific)
MTARAENKADPGRRRIIKSAHEKNLPPAPRKETIELVSPNEIKAHPRNQQIYGDEPDKDLISDISKRGMIEPIVVDRATCFIISGRRRHKAAITLKMPTVPVVWRDYETDDETVEAIVMHNAYRRKSERQIMMEVEAIWDKEFEKNKERQAEGGRKGRRGPASVYRKSDDTEIEIEHPEDDEDREEGGLRIAKKPKPKRRLTRNEVGKAIGQPPMKVARAAAIINQAKEELGENWMEHPAVQAVFKGESSINSAALAMHKQKREDKLIEEAKSIKSIDADIRCQDHINDIERESVDHIIVDPDYKEDTGYGDRLEETEALDVFEDWNSELKLDEVSVWAHEWARVIKTGGNIAVFCDERYVSFIREALISNGFDMVQVVTWHLTNPDTGSKKTTFLDTCQFIVTACMGADKRNAFHWKGPKQMHNFIEGATVKGRKALRHLGERPEFVLKWLVERLTNPGDLVLDNFAGTGTTGLACKRLKRNFILVEREPKNVEIIKARLSKR